MNYVLDENGNRVEGLSKEEMLAILQQAIDDGSLAGIEKDSAFVSKLKCCVNGETYQMAFVTQAKYNELFQNNLLTDNTFYYITDDPTEENIEANIEMLAKEIDATNEIIGEIIEGKVGDIIIPHKKLIYSGDSILEFNFDETIVNKKFEVVLTTGHTVVMETGSSLSTGKYTDVILYVTNVGDKLNIAMFRVEFDQLKITGKYRIISADIVNGSITENTYSNTVYGAIKEIYEIIE